MKRFYSHYTFISPQVYLKDVIVELDETNHITNIFQFKNEIESTEFYSGWLLFIDSKEDIQSVQTSITKLPPKYRDICDVDIESFAKIADIYNLNNIQIPTLKQLAL